VVIEAEKEQFHENSEQATDPVAFGGVGHLLDAGNRPAKCGGGTLCGDGGGCTIWQGPAFAQCGHQIAPRVTDQDDDALRRVRSG